LIGAWLGFHVPDVPGLGGFTAIVGAILGANVALIAFDIAMPAGAPAVAPEAPQARSLPGPT
jgi:hypothetical protein